MAKVSKRSSEFEQATREIRQGLLLDYWHFIRSNKKWWLLPIIVAIMLVGVLMIMGQGALAPFIYTLF